MDINERIKIFQKSAPLILCKLICINKIFPTLRYMPWGDIKKLILQSSGYITDL